MIKDALILTLFPAAMAFAAITDLFTMTVSNRLSLALAAGFFILAPMIGFGWEAIGLHTLTAFGALAAGFALFTAGLIGGGDAKFFAATVLWLGPEQLLTYGICVALLGGVLTVVILALRSLALPAALVSQGWLLRLHDPKSGVPYAVALAGAGLLVYPHTPFMAALGS